MAPQHPNPVAAGVMAADLLAEACWPGSGGDLLRETVRDLALDLGRRLDACPEPAGNGEPDWTVEAALACADLATLAACNVSNLPADGRPLAAVATHLAAGTARALLVLVESSTRDRSDTHSQNVLRDARSAGWKADLAIRQVSGEAKPPR